MSVRIHFRIRLETNVNKILKLYRCCCCTYVFLTLSLIIEIENSCKIGKFINRILDSTNTTRCLKLHLKSSLGFHDIQRYVFLNNKIYLVLSQEGKKLYRYVVFVQIAMTRVTSSSPVNFRSYTDNSFLITSLSETVSNSSLRFSFFADCLPFYRSWFSAFSFILFPSSLSTRFRQREPISASSNSSEYCVLEVKGGGSGRNVDGPGLTRLTIKLNPIQVVFLLIRLARPHMTIPI